MALGKAILVSAFLVLSPSASQAQLADAAPARAAAPAREDLSDLQNAANASPGPRVVPGRSLPVPSTASAAMQAAIASPYRSSGGDSDRMSDADWNEQVARVAALTAKMLPGLRAKLNVSVTPMMIGGVKAYLVQPQSVPPENANRLLIHLHGGGYVYNPGESGTLEAILMAGYGGFKIISVDYRMPPNAPYPAAMDDAMAVWKEALKMAGPKQMAIFGASTGGAMTLAMILRAKAEGLPLPAAIAPATPWADITETGDTYKTNEWVDNVLVSYSRYLRRASQLYAAGHDPKDPQISPIYGDFHGFPPAILISGTRDLFLSNTVRTHRKLRQAGVEAALHVFEGMSHIQYIFSPDTPETQEVFVEIAKFFDAHLDR